MLKKLKKAGALTLILLFTAFPISTQADVASVRNSVVRICSAYKDEILGTGSGFYIGKKDGYQYYVTNDHVVSITNSKTGAIIPTDTVIVFSDLYTKTDQIEAEVVYQTGGQGHDIAILRIPDTDEEKRTPATLKSCEGLNVADTVYVLGFPGVVDAVSDAGIALESNPENVTVSKGSVSNPNMSVNGEANILIDAVVNFGNSGGPLTDENGNVIGIIKWKMISEDGINGAIQSDELIDILESKGFPYNNSSSSSTAPKTTEKKSNTSKSKSTAPVFDGINEKTKMNFYMLLGFLLFFVLILVLVIIIVMMKKSSKKKNRRNDDWKNGSNRKRL